MDLRVNLFRRFKVYDGPLQLDSFNNRRVQELFCFLLLHRGRPHRREKLIEILWGEDTPKRANKYFRQLLWQLRSALPRQAREGDHALLAVDEEWISLLPVKEVSLDVDIFEQAFKLTQDIAGADLHPAQAEALQQAVQLYTGDLLEGWYQDWCIFERERLQNIYLLVLDRLMAYTECHAHYEAGIQYGVRALRCDPAREVTYQRLMRLCYLAGDRTGALRYYARCVDSLYTELQVSPTDQTKALHAKICASHNITELESSAASNHLPRPDQPEGLTALLETCRAVNQALRAAQQYNEENIERLVVKLFDL